MINRNRNKLQESSWVPHLYAPDMRGPLTVVHTAICSGAAALAHPRTHGTYSAFYTVRLAWAGCSKYDVETLCNAKSKRCPLKRVEPTCSSAAAFSTSGGDSIITFTNTRSPAE